MFFLPGPPTRRFGGGSARRPPQPGVGRQIQSIHQDLRRCACNPRRGDGPIAGAYPTLVHIWSAAVSLLMTIFGLMRVVFFVWLANRDREKPHGSPLPHHRADGSRTRRFGRLSRPVESPSAEAAQGFSARKPEPHLYPLQAHVHPVGCSHGLHWTTITPLFQVPLGTPFGPSVGSLAPRRRLPYYALC
jgi:hypothetical protein